MRKTIAALAVTMFLAVAPEAFAGSGRPPAPAPKQQPPVNAPEPTALVALGVGLIALPFLRRKS